MKWFALAAVLAVGAMGLPGCTEPIPAFQDKNHPLQVSLTDYWTQSKVRVNKIASERIGSGQLKVTVELYNRTDGELTLDYKPRFTDARGIQVDNEVGWQLVRLAPRGYQSFSFTSLSSAAEDFQVQIRKAQ